MGSCARKLFRLGFDCFRFRHWRFSSSGYKAVFGIWLYAFLASSAYAFKPDCAVVNQIYNDEGKVVILTFIDIHGFTQSKTLDEIKHLSGFERIFWESHVKKVMSQNPGSYRNFEYLEGRECH